PARERTRALVNGPTLKCLVVRTEAAGRLAISRRRRNRPQAPRFCRKVSRSGQRAARFGELQQMVGVRDVLDLLHQVEWHRPEAVLQYCQDSLLHSLSYLLGDQLVQDRRVDHGFCPSKDGVQCRVVVNWKDTGADRSGSAADGGSAAPSAGPGIRL